MTELDPDPLGGAEPAVPDSYGRAPRGYRLPEGIRLHRPSLGRFVRHLAEIGAASWRAVLRGEGTQLRVSVAEAG